MAFRRLPLAAQADGSGAGNRDIGRGRFRHCCGSRFPPLDPLSAAEIETAVVVLRAAG
jgi:hypothetical protein